MSKEIKNLNENDSLKHEIAESAEELEFDETLTGKALLDSCRDINHEKAVSDVMKGVAVWDSRPTIAVAKDEAFCFYYADNIHLLEEYGAKIRYFSLLRDEKLPGGCHALLIGGGYPEVYSKQLSTNTKMREAVKNAAENEMPIVAECGGFMYLHSFLKDKEGLCYDMAGVIPATCFYTGKLVRFGYIELWEKKTQTINPSNTDLCTFKEYYGRLLEDVAVTGNVYEGLAESLSGEVASIENNRQMVFGVSSDEELQNMIKYQSAYNASSRFINVISEMLEHLVTRL